MLERVRGYSCIDVPSNHLYENNLDRNYAIMENVPHAQVELVVRCINYFIEKKEKNKLPLEHVKIYKKKDRGTRKYMYIINIVSDKHCENDPILCTFIISTARMVCDAVNTYVEYCKMAAQRPNE